MQTCRYQGPATQRDSSIIASTQGTHGWEVPASSFLVTLGESLSRAALIRSPSAGAEFMLSKTAGGASVGGGTVGAA